MSFKNRCTISSSYEFQAHQQHSQRRCCFSQNALLWFEVLPDAHRFASGAPRCSAMQRDRQRVILRQRVRGSVRAVRAVRFTRVFQSETRVVADATDLCLLLAQASTSSESKRPKASAENATPTNAKLSQEPLCSRLWSRLWSRLSCRISSRLLIMLSIRITIRCSTRLSIMMHGNIAICCLCARVWVAQSLVDMHSCWYIEYLKDQATGTSIGIFRNLKCILMARQVICPALGNCTHIVIATTLRSLPKIV